MLIKEAKAHLEVQKMFRISEAEANEINEIMGYLDEKNLQNEAKTNRIYHIISDIIKPETVENILVEMADEAVLDAHFLDETIHRFSTFKDDFIYNFLVQRMHNSSDKIKNLSAAYMKMELKQNQLDEKTILKNYIAAVNSNKKLKKVMSSGIITRLQLEQDIIAYMDKCIDFSNKRIANFNAYVAPNKNKNITQIMTKI